MEYQIPEPIPEIYINKENSSLKERLFSSKIFWQLSTQEDNTKNFEPTETPSKNIENNELKSYLTIGGGTFIRGAWQPIYPFFGCNAWRVCFEKLEGINISATYTKETIKKDYWKFDYDFTGMIGYQSTDKNIFDHKFSSYGLQDGKHEGTFGVIGIIPTIRVSKLSNKIPIGIGIGVGPALSIGSRVVEKPYNFSSLVSQVNAEVNIPISKDNNTSITLGLSHVCSFLGLLNDRGRDLSHHWYTLGIRKRL